jgi:hypothetical protein
LFPERQLTQHRFFVLCPVAVTGTCSQRNKPLLRKEEELFPEIGL